MLAEKEIVTLRFAEGHDVRKLQSEKGSIFFWKITSTVYATHVQGHLSQDMARRSKLVAMGVSVENLALGNMIESHSSPATLEVALDRLLESRDG